MIGTHSSLPDKIVLISKILIVGLIIILGRLTHLQVIQWHALYTKSQRNCVRVETVSPLRGNILDCNGQLLATNRPTINVYWQGQGNKKLTPEQDTLITKLEQIFQKPLFDDAIFMKDLALSERLCRRLPLAQDIPFEQHGQIVEQLHNEKNIVISTHFKRHYPYASWACHALGYLGHMNQDMYGKMGLEKLFEETLRGQQGEKMQIINSVGRHLHEVEIKKALAGDNIQTTFDIRLQTIIEEVFPADWTGTFLILDPQTGSIRAILSRPDFDPSLFLQPLDHEEWLVLQNRHPFINRSCNACYPPGSIFKLVTLSVALEQGFITPESYWMCRGSVEFAGREYHCNNKHGHGLLNTEQALAYSCNILFFELGKRLTIDMLADYAHRYGLGNKTNIMFAEKEGLIPSSTWKRQVKGEKWWPGETLSAAIGQSYLLVTPIQVACMISSIFTGHLVTPRILENEPIVQKPLAIKTETRRFLQQSMKSTVMHGTGQRIRQVKDIIMYAKTSTAQTSSLEKKELGKTCYLEHGWFTGYFSYAHYDPLTIVILVENAGSSLVATNLAKEFLIRYKKMMDAA